MAGVEIWQVVLGTVGTIGASWLLYLGVKRTASAAKEGVKQTAQVDAQESALAAWQALLEPYRQEVATLRAELNDERNDRNEQGRLIAIEQANQRREMERLQSEVARWQRVARTIAGWATQLRDEVLKLGGTVPATPEELLTLQAIDDAAEQP